MNTNARMVRMVHIVAMCDGVCVCVLGKVRPIFFYSFYWVRVPCMYDAIMIVNDIHHLSRLYHPLSRPSY